MRFERRLAIALEAISDPNTDCIIQLSADTDCPKKSRFGRKPPPKVLHELWLWQDKYYVDLIRHPY